ncbi:MAG: glutathione S-transferase [Rhodocyclales bacterium]|nr:glutathione S-transferase [Rhodocyclales bacterium]
MLKLCGFAVSNYYNKVKLSLLEKGIPFEEELAYPSQKEDFRKDSPMGKVPFLRTDRGVLTESQVLTEYIEDMYPEPALYPKDPFERARIRELIEHIELHLELPARRLYYEVFFGGSVSDETRKEVEQQLEKGVRSLTHLARFEPYIGGKEFTHADCAAFVHLPLVSMTTKKAYGRDFIDEFLPIAKRYLKMIGERPHAQKINADRKAAQDAYAATKAKK